MELILTLAIVALATLVLGLGVLLTGQPPRRSCDGTCAACPNRKARQDG